jgi:hypothetical protein
MLGAVVEVASLFEPGAWQAERSQHEAYADYINERVAADGGYFIDFDFLDPNRVPPVSRYVAWLRRTLAGLGWPPEDPSVAHEATFWDPAGDITTRFIPMGERREDPGLRIVGMGPMIGGRVDTASRVRDRVNGKLPSRYDVPDGVPYLVVVGVRDFPGVRSSGVSACYGTPTVSVPSGEPGRAGDGVFGPTTDGRGRNERLSAVGVLWDLKPWDEGEPRLELFHNPYARSPWPHGGISAAVHFGVLERTTNGVSLGWLDHPET